ncbi:hypothetical protein NPIL_346591 [Nephila pilipes]|uniref:Uncharacterized protein n=1 Tax=Nephila pilipes TaxID=299642 RepID=A0A8X6T7N5_NEPPI|nr:hypothetical protein NPIL_346591 [Nephila pilipes]
MSTSSGDNTLQACHKSSNGRMFDCKHDSSQRIAFFNSDRLDGRDRYTRNFKYPHSQKTAAVSSGDPRRPWKLAIFANDSFSSEHLCQEFLDWISSGTCCSILHKRNSRKLIFFTQAWNDLFEQKC